MKWVVLVLVLLGAGVALRIEYSSVRADLIAQREAIDAEWTQVNEAIQRRAEETPHWLRAVARTAPEVASVEEQWNAAHRALAAAKSPEEKIRANQEIDKVLTKLQGIAASHPKVDASDTLSHLSDAENRIAVERRRYNDMLEHYNAQIQRFPDNIVASVAGFSRDNAYFPTEPRP